jgi:hypothetical protein
MTLDTCFWLRAGHIKPLFFFSFFHVVTVSIDMLTLPSIQGGEELPCPMAKQKGMSAAS